MTELPEPDKHTHHFLGPPDDGWYSQPREDRALFGEGMTTILGQLWHAHDELPLHQHYQNGYARKPGSGNGPSLYVFGKMQATAELQEGRYGTIGGSE